MKYESIYSFHVLNKIGEGKTVYYLDRKLHDCGKVNNITVNDFTCILEQAKENPTRFEFWVEIETESEECSND